MDLIKGLLGFAVLTSPLWLIVILLPVTIWVAIKIAKRFEKTNAKLASACSVFLLVLLVLFADEIVGKMYFDHLCATEAGMNVYGAAELPAEYWDKNGEPKFLNRYGKPDHKLWVKTFDRSDRNIETYSSIFSIDKDISLVKEKTSQKVLMKVTTYRYWGGWVRRNFSLHNTANSCKFMDDPTFRRNYYNSLFKPSNNSK